MEKVGEQQVPIMIKKKKLLGNKARVYLGLFYHPLARQDLYSHIRGGSSDGRGGVAQPDQQQLQPPGWAGFRLFC